MSVRTVDPDPDGQGQEHLFLSKIGQTACHKRGSEEEVQDGKQAQNRATA